MTTPTIPAKHTAAYRAGAYLHANGPKSQTDLLCAIDFGSPSKARDCLQRAIRSGWLVVTAGDAITLGDLAHAHFTDLGAEEPKYVGQIVPPRSVNLMDRPAYVPERRIVRRDAMDNSLAAMPSKFHRELP